MKNSLLTMAFLGASILFAPAQVSAHGMVGQCGCNNVASGYCYKGPTGVKNPCARVGVCGCVIKDNDGGYCGDPGTSNPCLDKEFADTHRYE